MQIDPFDCRLPADYLLSQKIGMDPEEELSLGFLQLERGLVAVLSQSGAFLAFYGK